MPVNPSFIRPQVFAPAAAAPAGIVPSDVTGLVAWFKADAGTYQNNDGSTPAAADGDVVGYWADQSGNGYHATEATNKPVLKTGANGINSRAVIRCDGANDKLTTASITHSVGTGDWWWIMVCRMITAPTWGVMVENGSLAPGMLCRTTTFGWSLYLGSYFCPFADGAIFTLNKTFLLEMGRSGTTLYGVRNGVAGDQTAVNAGNVANAALQFFYQAGWGGPNMDLGEFIFYDNKPSADDLTGLRAYLNGRWACY